jgi:rubrerythrin
MLAKIPVEIKDLTKEDVNKEALRLAVIAELDAINLYEQLASMVDNEGIKKILLEVAKEEKTHVGEFLALLLKFDEEQVKELKKGEGEVKEVLE